MHSFGHNSIEKLNGPGYGTNVHIFILGSCNILSFTNISLSMWEELWWQSARWIVRDVDRFWSSRQIAWCPLRPGVWDKWCKILHSRPLLALNFIIETSFFCTIFLIFSAIVQDKRPFLLLLIILWQWFRHLLFDDWRKKKHLKSEVIFYSATLFSKIFCIKRLLHTKEIASLFVLWIFFKLSLQNVSRVL